MSGWLKHSIISQLDRIFEVVLSTFRQNTIILETKWADNSHFIKYSYQTHELKLTVNTICKIKKTMFLLKTIIWQSIDIKTGMH